WQPAPIRSWSLVRTVSFGRMGLVAQKSSSSPKKNRRKKTKAKPRRSDLNPRQLSPSRQRLCRHHDSPNCDYFHSETTSGGRAEGRDRSYDRPVGEDLWRSSRGGRSEHACARG